MVVPSVKPRGSMKRTSPSFQDDSRGWGAAPPMPIPSQPTIHLPYAHYALIYLDGMGQLHVQESLSIRRRNETVFTQDVQQRFLDALGPRPGRPGYRSPNGTRTSGAGDMGFGYGYDQRMRQPVGESHGLPVGQVKRRRSSTQDPANFADPVSITAEIFPQPSATNKVELQIGDTEKVVAYYTNALVAFQQLNCRQVAKAFIKFIEPRKQVKHPYNGGRPSPGAPPGSKGDPEKTKPAWWPAGVIHKEPDHLKKEQRLRLLLHIIRKLGKFGITADKLLEVARDTKRQFKGTGKLEVLEEIFYVRKMEERYERGEIDPDSRVYVANRNAGTKLDKDSDSVDEPEDEEDDDDDEIMTPVSSMDEDSTAMADFQVSEHLSFEEPARQDQTFYPSSSEYSEDFSSQSMIRTPASSVVLSPTEQQPPFRYLTPAHFSTSTPEDQVAPPQAMLPVQPPTNSIDTWAAPSFRQNIFGSIDFGTATTQSISQQTMPFHIPVTSTTLPQGITHHAPSSHGLPDLTRPRAHDQLNMTDMRTPSFRTGSLGHPNVVPPPQHSE